MKDVSELLGEKISLEDVGGEKISYEGYVFLPFQLQGVEAVNVPFLVTNEKMEQPLVGYNVIKTTTEKATKAGVQLEPESFPELGTDQVRALGAFLLKDSAECIATVKSNKFDCTIRAGAEISIPCKINTLRMPKTMPVLFQPTDEFADDTCLSIKENIVKMKKGTRTRIFLTIQNSGLQDVVIPARTHLGNLQQINSIIPAETKFKEFEKPASEDNSEEGIVLDDDSRATPANDQIDHDDVNRQKHSRRSNLTI